MATGVQKTFHLVHLDRAVHVVRAVLLARLVHVAAVLADQADQVVAKETLVIVVEVEYLARVAHPVLAVLVRAVQVAPLVRAARVA